MNENFVPDIPAELLASVYSISKSPSLPYKIVIRAEIVLEALNSNNILKTSERFNTSRLTVRTWKKRILEFAEKLTVNLLSDRKFLRSGVEKALSDKERSGHPDIYTMEQTCQIIKTALESPEKFKLNDAVWNIPLLTYVVKEQKIAPSISERTVGRILNSIDLKPFKIKYWLNPKIENKDEFDDRVKAICQLYKSALEKACLGIHVVSVDEKTGIQALERIHNTINALPGYPAKIEYEYKRHGTVCLIPSFKVSNGKIINYYLGDTRNEQDFANHIEKTISTAPEDTWVFVADQLNTHMSETLVRTVARKCDIKHELGVKNISGILKNRKSRMEFLEDSTHRIRFLYTPKHCSWLNQIEIWFSQLTRKLLKNNSFKSKQQLIDKIEEFIELFNNTIAKPYKWTYQGKALKI